MPNFVSIKGKMFPGKESAMMKNTFGKTLESEFITASDGSHVVKVGENFLYNGPDREAVKMLKQEGLEYLGHDFKSDPEFLQAIRNMGFNNTEDYLKQIGYDEKKDTEKQESLLSIFNKHTDPEKVEEILVLAGGRDFSGNKDNNIIGGFGDERIRKPEEITTSKPSKK